MLTRIFSTIHSDYAQIKRQILFKLSLNRPWGQVSTATLDAIPQQAARITMTTGNASDREASNLRGLEPVPRAREPGSTRVADADKVT